MNGWAVAATPLASAVGIGALALGAKLAMSDSKFPTRPAEADNVDDGRAYASPELAGAEGLRDIGLVTGGLATLLAVANVVAPATWQPAGGMSRTQAMIGCAIFGAVALSAAAAGQLHISTHHLAPQVARSH